MFYTYAYLREDKTPYYIGKGKGTRMYSKNHRVLPPSDKNLIVVLKDNLTEEEAFQHEMEMIQKYGRKDLGTGILRNMTNGGEGNSGRIIPEHQRKLISERNSYPRSEEHKQKISKTLKGVKKTEYHSKNISLAMKGRKRGPYKKTSKYP
jgi:hypothetical protein